MVKQAVRSLTGPVGSNGITATATVVQAPLHVSLNTAIVDMRGLLDTGRRRTTRGRTAGAAPQAAPAAAQQPVQ